MIMPAILFISVDSLVPRIGRVEAWRHLRPALRLALQQQRVGLEASELALERADIAAILQKEWQTVQKVRAQRGVAPGRGIRTQQL